MPPAGGKYGYWENDTLVEDPDAWLKAAQQHPGSWWTNWLGWVQPNAGEMIPARIPGYTLGALEDAPGSYVKAKLA